MQSPYGRNEVSQYNANSILIMRQVYSKPENVEVLFLPAARKTCGILASAARDAVRPQSRLSLAFCQIPGPKAELSRIYDGLHVLFSDSPEYRIYDHRRALIHKISIRGRHKIPGRCTYCITRHRRQIIHPRRIAIAEKGRYRCRSREV